MQSFSRKSIGMMSAALSSFAFLLVASIWSISPAATPESGIEKVYLRKCAVCHGPDGAGKTAKGKKVHVKDVRDQVQKISTEEMIKGVATGKDKDGVAFKDMAAFGKELSKEQIEEIVNYYRGLAKK